MLADRSYEKLIYGWLFEIYIPNKISWNEYPVDLYEFFFPLFLLLHRRYFEWNKFVLRLKRLIRYSKPTSIYTRRENHTASGERNYVGKRTSNEWMEIAFCWWRIKCCLSLFSLNGFFFPLYVIHTYKYTYIYSIEGLILHYLLESNYGTKLCWIHMNWSLVII